MTDEPTHIVLKPYMPHETSDSVIKRRRSEDDLPPDIVLLGHEREVFGGWVAPLIIDGEMSDYEILVVPSWHPDFDGDGPEWGMGHDHYWFRFEISLTDEAKASGKVMEAEPEWLIDRLEQEMAWHWAGYEYRRFEHRLIHESRADHYAGFDSWHHAYDGYKPVWAGQDSIRDPGINIDANYDTVAGCRGFRHEHTKLTEAQKIANTDAYVAKLVAARKAKQDGDKKDDAA